MSFIGQDQRPAPKVKEVRLSQEEMTSAYQQCIEVGEVRGGRWRRGKEGGGDICPLEKYFLFPWLHSFCRFGCIHVPITYLPLLPYLCSVNSPQVDVSS